MKQNRIQTAKLTKAFNSLSYNADIVKPHEMTTQSAVTNGLLEGWSSQRGS